MQKQSHKPNSSAFLLSSSCLFNQKRIQIAKAKQKQEDQRRNKLLHECDQEDVSMQMEISQPEQSLIQTCREKRKNKFEFDEFQNVLMNELMPNNNVNTNEVVNMLRIEQNAIDCLIQQLGKLRNGLKDYQNAHIKMNQTDISQQDLQFLKLILFKHGYIRQNNKDAKINDIFPEIKQKLIQERQKAELQKQNAKNMINSIPLVLEVSQSSHNAILQNHRKSKKQDKNQLCSIANQLNSKLDNKTNNNLNIKINDFIYKCSRQLDLQDVRRQAKEQEKRNKNYIIKESKRYLTENSICYEHQSQKYKYQVNNEQESSYNKQNFKITEQNLGSQEIQINNNYNFNRTAPNNDHKQNKKHVHKPSIIVNEPSIKHIDYMLAKIQLPETKTIKGSKVAQNVKNQRFQFKQPLTPRRWVKQNRNINKIIKIKTVQQQFFGGIIGNIQCQVYYSSITKVLFKNATTYIIIKQIGEYQIQCVNSQDIQILLDNLTKYQKI